MTSTPSKKFYRDGYFLSLENSKSLSKIANKAAEEKEFGIACSLKILAAEESIKACSLITMHYSKDVDVTGLDKIFKDHKTKHNILSETSTIIQATIDVTTTEFGVLDYLFETFRQCGCSIHYEPRPPLLRAAVWSPTNGNIIEKP